MEQPQKPCENCGDEGIVRLSLGWIAGFKRCNCRPAEYWDQKFNEKMDRWYNDFFGPEERLSGGEMEYTGRQADRIPGNALLLREAAEDLHRQ